MTAGELTAIAVAVTAFLSSIVIPAVLRRRQSGVNTNRTKVVSWEGITDTLQEERNRLQARLDTRETEHNAQIVALNAEWQRKIDALNAQWQAKLSECEARITQQQGEIDALRRLLQPGT
ncbi:MAG: hypothetical protein NVSMB4_02640 [Acidimicrobiales bacterium]